MSIATLYQSRLLPGRPRRAFGLRTVCGDKGEAKAVRKRLQRKQYDLEDATAALRTLPLNYDATSQLAVVYNIKRLACETEVLLREAERLLHNMSMEVETEQKATLPTSEGQGQDKRSNLAAITEILEGRANDLHIHDHQPATIPSVPQGSFQESGESSRMPLSHSSTPPIASQLPAGERLWSEAREALGSSSQAKVTICQGKSCCKAGSAEVWKVMEDIAGSNPGLELATSKCLDKCKQGPTVQINCQDGSSVVCVSKDKPPKKEKKKLGGNILQKVSSAFAR